MAFYTLARDIGLPIKAEKTVYPTTTLTFLGLELDTLKFEVRLPPDKLESMKSEIRKFQNKTTASLQELQSLIGLLNFSCRVVPPGRPFLRRIINLTMGLKKPKRQKRLDSEAIADLKAWAIFLENFNGKAFFPSGIFILRPHCTCSRMPATLALAAHLVGNGSLGNLSRNGSIIIFRFVNSYQLL